MIRIERTLYFVLPLALGLAMVVAPGRAQPTSGGRFAFADTLLLRDTLGLDFDRLFPLADSLHLVPDSLRALAIRYRLGLGRMVFLADSLRLPVDSVGPVLQRERFNPLGAAVERVTAFVYNSSFSIARRTNTWGNSSDYNFVWGGLFVRNVTDVSITRTRDGNLTERFKARSSSTEAGWRFSPNFSLGTRVSLQGSESFKPGSIYNTAESTNQFDFSVRARQQPMRTLRSDVNLFGGPFDEPNSIPVKRGFGGVLSGHLRFTPAKWLSQDLSVQATGRFGRAQLPGQAWLGTRDISSDLRGNVSLFEASPLKLRVGFQLRHSELQRPDTLTRRTPDPVVVDIVRGQPNSSRSVDLGVRFDRRNGDYLGMSGGLSEARNLVAARIGEVFRYDLSLSGDRHFDVVGRATFRGWSLDTRFSNGFPTSDQPRRGTGGVTFRESQNTHSRSIDATVQKNLTAHVVFRAAGGVNLASYTQVAQGVSTRTLDDYRQFYRLEGLYSASNRLSSGTKLEVSRILALNLQASSSASTREDRTYRAEWRWTYRLMPGLTTNQLNQLSAIYTRNPFASERNRLSLEYLTVTTLDAAVTPRLAVTVTHNARLQPSGGYTRDANGIDSFSRSDEGRDYTLSGSIAYSPSPALTLSLQPSYGASDREGTVNGQSIPNSRRRSLSFSGGAGLNLPVSAKGRLSGSLARNFSSSRSTRFPNGRPEPDPRFQDDFWSGSLQLSWQL